MLNRIIPASDSFEQHQETYAVSVAVLSHLEMARWQLSWWLKLELRPAAKRIVENLRQPEAGACQLHFHYPAVLIVVSSIKRPGAVICNHEVAARMVITIPRPPVRFE